MIKSGIIISAIFISFSVFAQNEPIDVNIPMRDGKSLAGDLYLPNTTSAFPTILIMTPYGKFFYRLNGLPLGIGNDIANSEYAVLVVDWRCRFASLSACALGSNNGEDGYDVIEWSATQDWSDGKIGMWGPSALGNIQFQTAQQKAPHHVCSVPEVAAPHFSFKKYFPGGALTTERFETLNILFPGAFDLVIQNPHYNLLWTIAENTSMYPEDIEIPLLLVGGWYDINLDQTIYLSDTLFKNSPASAQHKTIIGPWVHGGTGQSIVGSTIQGDLSYPEAENYNALYALDFFDYHLRGIENDWDKKERYTYFQMGINEWNSSSTWPPENRNNLTFYLNEQGNLDQNPPDDSNGQESYSYDPEDPSPTVGGKTLNLDLDQGPYDQSDLVESRDDGLLFTSEEFLEDLDIVGSIIINLFVSSDVGDTDFAIRLTEIYQDGRSMLLSDQIQRLRFRNGYGLNDVELMTNGEIYPISLELEDLAVSILAGNRIGLYISSSNYPRYNRNMNTGKEMYPDNNMDTLVNPIIAKYSVYFINQYPSNLNIPISNKTVSTVSPQAFDYEVKLLENPVRNQLKISANQHIKSVSIYDQNGKTVAFKKIKSTKVELDISNLPPGLFFCKLSFDKAQRHIESFIKID